MATRSLRRPATALALVLALALPAGPAAAIDERRLSAMSLEDLMNLEVTSVSKRAQKLSRAPAAITVLSGEEIRRAGHESIPEALRMVPGINVARMGTHKWAITSRGFNGQNGEFANKLLVLVDGRSVYTPSHSGVYWDLQDVVMEDIDRIEVIRGPGGTLWGANAVNGVINVITKSASETQGLLLSAGGGNYDRAQAVARFGGRIGENAAYRVFSKGFDRQAYPDPGPRNDAGDDWSMGRAGFRVDWDPTSADSFTFHGDFFRGELDNRTSFESGGFDSTGGYLLAEWSHAFSETSQLRFQAYYDAMDRKDPLANDRRQTGDLELQHDLLLGRRHQVAWGLNYRITSDRIEGSLVDFEHPREVNDSKGVFLQDQIMLLEDELYLTLGTKLEHNDFSGLELQPSARIAWSPDERQTLWGAVSRAVRTPSRAEDDIRLRLPAGLATAEVTGSTEFTSEQLLAYEIGYRRALRSNLTVDATAFYFDYDDLLTLEPQLNYVDPDIGLVLPLVFQNNMNGHSYGAELEAHWQVLPYWRLSAGYAWLNLNLSPDPDSNDTIGAPLEHSSPTHQASLRSFVDLPRGFELDTMLYYVENLPGKVGGDGNPIGSYVRADVRVGWRPNERLELSVVGQNLLADRNEEFSGALLTRPVSVPRSFFGKLTWRY